MPYYLSKTPNLQCVNTLNDLLSHVPTTQKQTTTLGTSNDLGEPLLFGPYFTVVVPVWHWVILCDLGCSYWPWVFLFDLGHRRSDRGCTTVTGPPLHLGGSSSSTCVWTGPCVSSTSLQDHPWPLPPRTDHRCPVLHERVITVAHTEGVTGLGRDWKSWISIPSRERKQRVYNPF